MSLFTKAYHLSSYKIDCVMPNSIKFETNLAQYAIYELCVNKKFQLY